MISQAQKQARVISVISDVQCLISICLYEASAYIIDWNHLNMTNQL